MRFKIFGLHEKIYIKIAYGSVLIATLISLIYYAKMEEKNDSFIIGILYALLLFIISIYITNMTNKIQNLFYTKKEQYLALKQLEVVFLSFKQNRLSTDLNDRAVSFLLFHRVFTGRMEQQGGEQGGSILRRGFSYKKWYLEMEDEIYKQNTKILKTINDGINKYIGSNKLSKKRGNVCFDKIFFSIEDLDSWQSKELDLNSEQRKKFRQFGNELLKKIKKPRRKFRRNMYTMVVTHRWYCYRINNEIERMEVTYGDRLINEISFIDSIDCNLKILQESIKDVENKLPLHSDIEEIKNIMYKLDSSLEKNKN